MDAEALEVIDQFGLQPIQRLEKLGSAGGFSGAQFWRFEVPACDIGLANPDTSEVDDPTVAKFCLRRWPTPHPDFERLNWIHLVLNHLAACDCNFIPTPLADLRGKTIVSHRGYRWEVTRWLPGSADFHRRNNSRRLTSMMHSVARIHQAAAQVNLQFGASTNVAARIRQLGKLDSLLIAAEKPGPSPCREPLDRLRHQLRRFQEQDQGQLMLELKQFSPTTLPIQPVIRDLWHDHILFTDDTVTGIVDFGAMQLDTVAMDLSRLLGSTLADHADLFPQAIEEYQLIRPLTPDEIRLIPLLDRTSVVLGGANWLKWIAIEGRQFENWNHVNQRISSLTRRLENGNWFSMDIKRFEI